MTLKITSAQVENFKRIKEIDVEQLGDVVTIGGRNAQGKSSFIDAIWNTLGGKQRDITRPVRDGEAKATSTITIEDTASGVGLVVTRTWKAGGASTLKVKPLGGSGDVNKPQDTLNDLIGAFAFDPLAFATLEASKRRQALIDLIGLDLSAMDDRYDAAYEARRQANAEVKRLKGSVESLERPAANLPDEFVSVSALIKERDTMARVADGVERAGHRIGAIDAELRALQLEREELVEKQQQGRSWSAGRRDLSEIEHQIENAESTNQAIHAAQAYRERRDELKAAERLATARDLEVTAAKQAKIDALEAAELPLEGLSFDNDDVLYQGQPFSQASAAEKRKVSMSIAMAMNPELKVICLKDASLIDEEGQQQIRDLAAENDFQLILEMVGSSGGETIVIEDGEVA